MKKIINCFVLLLILLLVAVPAFSVSEATNKYSSIMDLFQYWETNGYPEYVGGVRSADGSANNLMVLLVNDDETTKEMIRSLLIDDTGLSFGKAPYSNSSLMEVYDEIVADYADNMGDNGINYIGVALNSVIVRAEKSEVARYSKEFAEKYGDMVEVEVAFPLYEYSDSGSETSVNMLWLWIVIGVGLLGASSVLLWRRVRQRNISAIEKEL